MAPAAKRATEAHNAKARLAESYNEIIEEFATSKDLKNVGNYTVLRMIGKGSFGTVYLATHKLTGMRVVLKSADKSDLNLAREIHHHRQLDHPHITKLYEVIITETLVWLVLEYCAGDELYTYLLRKGRLSIERTQRIFSQLCGAMAYIHWKDIVHRDLKLENILMDRHENVKIADFGFTRECDSKKLLETFCGTICYAPPEMVRAERYRGKAVDIWSLGVILYALICGELPFDEDDELATRTQIVEAEPKYPSYVPDDARSLLVAMLSKAPSERPTIDEILAHPFLGTQAATQRAILDRPDPTPFASKLERELLRRFKHAAVDVNALVESVLADKCDVLAGWWTLALEREIKTSKRSRRKKAKRDKERERFYKRSSFHLRPSESATDRPEPEEDEAEDADEAEEPPLIHEISLDHRATLSMASLQRRSRFGLSAFKHHCAVYYSNLKHGKPLLRRAQSHDLDQSRASAHASGTVSNLAYGIGSIGGNLNGRAEPRKDAGKKDAGKKDAGKKDAGKAPAKPVPDAAPGRPPSKPAPPAAVRARTVAVSTPPRSANRRRSETDDDDVGSPYSMHRRPFMSRRRRRDGVSREDLSMRSLSRERRHSSPSSSLYPSSRRLGAPSTTSSLSSFRSHRLSRASSTSTNSLSSLNTTTTAARSPGPAVQYLAPLTPATGSSRFRRGTAADSPFATSSSSAAVRRLDSFKMPRRGTPVLGELGIDVPARIASSRIASRRLSRRAGGDAVFVPAATPDKKLRKPRRKEDDNRPPGAPVIREEDEEDDTDGYDSEDEDEPLAAEALPPFERESAETAEAEAETPPDGDATITGPATVADPPVQHPDMDIPAPVPLRA
ncbi:kinase-like domain-containing protein [Dipodascopsis tothii]|uniref:kinase-like domain-containing protein n=1 Tax=Dipodascopsis tothii TaxID=44089 RepID=UPI0034CD12ED